MLYLVQGWKDGEFFGMVVTLAELAELMNTLPNCNVFMLRPNNYPLPVRIEEYFNISLWVYDDYNNLMEMHFYNGTNKTED